MDARVFICGPPRMNDELLAVTQRLGYAEEKVTVL
jgi:NAD(P)H-flavin reductase